MKKTLLTIGSLVVVVLLFGAVFPSVAGYQTEKTLHDQYLTTMKNTINSILGENEHTAWQPGIFILLFLTVMQGVTQAIAEGKWFPGMISGAFILYLVLAWLIIFAEDVDIDT
jgi:hypothetical protein